MITLLTGSVENQNEYLSRSPLLQVLNITPPNKQTICTQKRTVLVPALEERVGLAYAFDFYRCYNFKLEVGYQAQIYIGAIQTVDIGSEVVTPPVIPDTIGVYARTFQRNISNFALAGPYVNFDLKF